jgi:hypothetical protein
MHHYQGLFTSNMPWAISGIAQNVMLQNPFAGERRKWRSP